MMGRKRGNGILTDDDVVVAARHIRHSNVHLAGGNGEVRRKRAACMREDTRRQYARCHELERGHARMSRCSLVLPSSM